jgi:hypothetical protein
MLFFGPIEPMYTVPMIFLAPSFKIHEIFLTALILFLLAQCSWSRPCRPAPFKKLTFCVYNMKSVNQPLIQKCWPTTTWRARRLFFVWQSALLIMTKHNQSRPTAEYDILWTNSAVDPELGHQHLNTLSLQISQHHWPNVSRYHNRRKRKLTASSRQLLREVSSMD